ncbi:uncharacterized protein DDB_G0283357-like [Schistocerca serialis cubense]|uniref:uncharacterized protein DDB_G0283357-like n=1 Tax=Schistocerca serialis cubense TaxID=2023355 RepID=UPI00214F273A|nr:uncharacterized protein DDB_G0283357-like [Schistocerca serialis cubense]
MTHRITELECAHLQMLNNCGMPVRNVYGNENITCSSYQQKSDSERENIRFTGSILIHNPVGAASTSTSNNEENRINKDRENSNGSPRKFKNGNNNSNFGSHGNGKEDQSAEQNRKNGNGQPSYNQKRRWEDRGHPGYSNSNNNKRRNGGQWPQQSSSANYRTYPVQWMQTSMSPPPPPNSNQYQCDNRNSMQNTNAIPQTWTDSNSSVRIVEMPTDGNHISSRPSNEQRPQ